jgi:hypothetical protein
MTICHECVLKAGVHGILGLIKYLQITLEERVARTESQVLD